MKLEKKNLEKKLRLNAYAKEKNCFGQKQQQQINDSDIYCTSFKLRIIQNRNLFDEFVERATNSNSKILIFCFFHKKSHIYFTNSSKHF